MRLDSKDANCGKTMSLTTNGSRTSHEHSNETLTNANMLQTDSLGWIYLVRKDKLIEVCRENGITITARGTVDQLRRQLSELIRTKRQRPSSENLLRSLEEELLNEEKYPFLTNEQPEISLPVPSLITINHDTLGYTDLLQMLRRWNLTYQGGADFMEFLERLEELSVCYGFECNRFLLPMLEILKDRALQWYRVKRESIHTWADFKAEGIGFFLPKRYLNHLEEMIYLRKQGSKERAKDYILTLQSLIRQQPDIRKKDHTDRIYEGLRCEYKLYVRRNDFHNLDELMELTDEYEILSKNQ